MQSLFILASLCCIWSVPTTVEFWQSITYKSQKFLENLKHVLFSSLILISLGYVLRNGSDLTIIDAIKIYFIGSLFIFVILVPNNCLMNLGPKVEWNSGGICNAKKLD
ncbi:MAG: hypothetical protein MHMPM18_005096 [Marteilia pararefringens]